MGLELETRRSGSPWIHSVWTGRSPGVHEMTTVATETIGVVFTELDGVRTVSVTGPDEPHLARMLRRDVGGTARERREGRGGALALDPAQRTTSYTSLVTPLP